MLSPEQHRLWEKFLFAYDRAQLPKALLLIHSEKVSCQGLIDHMLQRLLCNEVQGPCGRCQGCRLFQLREHPDLYLITSLEGEMSIKIEAIRQLQETLFLPPQISNRRVVFLGELEHLTPAALSALLKTIEEPPEQVFFVGLTQQIHQVPLTLLSRFQRWVVNEKPDFLCPELPHLKEELMNFLQGRLSVVALADTWSAHPPRTLFNGLYALFAQMIQSRYSRENHTEEWHELSNGQCWMILQAIETAVARLLATPSLNMLLLIETWLIEVMKITDLEKSS